MDAINVITPQCRDCDRLAAGFVRWPQYRITDSPWTPKCDQHIPWQDADAVVVGIRHLGNVRPDHHDPAAKPDHPGHVHVRYVDNISADHPADT